MACDRGPEDEAIDLHASISGTMQSNGQKFQTVRHPWLARLSCSRHIPHGGVTGEDAVSLLGGLVPKRGRTAAR
jgi:hypothetical protein